VSTIEELVAFTLSSDDIEDWAERAAIREYMGGQSRDDAERAAYEDVQRARSKRAVARSL
jgi:hypothetical protein